jgi:hypothetical protein
MRNRSKTTMPGFSATASLSNRQVAYRAAFTEQGGSNGLVVPQSCNVLEWVGCASAVAGCAALCIGSFSIGCIACVAAAAPGCVKCFT